MVVDLYRGIVPVSDCWLSVAPRGILAGAIAGAIVVKSMDSSQRYGLPTENAGLIPQEVTIDRLNVEVPDIEVFQLDRVLVGMVNLLADLSLVGESHIRLIRAAGQLLLFVLPVCGSLLDADSPLCHRHRRDDQSLEYRDSSINPARIHRPGPNTE